MSDTALYDLMKRPMRDLRISLTDRCNFNCVYCMPDKDIEFLPREELLSFEEMEVFTRVVAKLGVQKIKITGGEPTLRVGLDVLIRKLAAIPGIDDVGLITNGVFLKGIGHRLKNAGLKRISISLDAMDERVFQKIIGNMHSIHPVLEGIEVAHELGFTPIKINCVLQRGLNDDQILPLAEYFRRPGFHLRFIEFMDVGSIDWGKDKVVTSKEILGILQERYELEPVNAEYYGEVAARFRYLDGMGEVGFISSVSQPFCRECTRLRISANGVLFGCLFADDGLDIKAIMRPDKSTNHSSETMKSIEENLIDAITTFWKNRSDRYSEQRAHMNETQRGKAMNFMGG